VKLLTMITVITTPVMIVGTWYGMNFKNLPEVDWPHGYRFAFGMTAIATALTYLWFKKKKWF
jgi:magnesium transporter